MQNRTRLLGVDLFRGLAAFMVVVLHARANPALQPSYWEAQLLILASFAVPFFLAAAFYFAIAKLYQDQASFSLKARFTRLLLPYAVWSGVYVAMRIGKNLAVGDADKIASLFQDPLALTCFGGAAVHLYFLPLLFTGLVCVKSMSFLIKPQTPVWKIGLLFGGSLLSYWILLASKNGFQLGQNLAFQGLWLSVLPGTEISPLLRLVTVLSAWVIKCLPYIFLSMLLAHPVLKPRMVQLQSPLAILGYGVVLLWTVFNPSYLPGLSGAVREIGMAYTSLLLALSLSRWMQDHPLLRNLGFCSFGIYLLHHLVLEVLVVGVGKVYPAVLSSTSLLSLLTFSGLGFLISWAIVAPLKEQKLFEKLM